MESVLQSHGPCELLERSINQIALETTEFPSRERKANRSRLLGVGDEREPGGEQKAEELTVVVSKSDTPQETEDLFFKKKRVPSSRYAASLGCPRNAADARVLSLSPRSSTHSLSLSLSAHQDAQRRE